MKTVVKAWNYFDKQLEQDHPYIAGFICFSCLMASLYGLMIIGHMAGY